MKGSWGEVRNEIVYIEEDMKAETDENKDCHRPSM